MVLEDDDGEDITARLLAVATTAVEVEDVEELFDRSGWPAAVRREAAERRDGGGEGIGAGAGCEKGIDPVLPLPKEENEPAAPLTEKDLRDVDPPVEGGRLPGLASVFVLSFSRSRMRCRTSLQCGFSTVGILFLYAFRLEKPAPTRVRRSAIMLPFAR